MMYITAALCLISYTYCRYPAFGWILFFPTPGLPGGKLRRIKPGTQQAHMHGPVAPTNSEAGVPPPWSHHQTWSLSCGGPENEDVAFGSTV